MAKAKKIEQEEALEMKLWKAADKLRKNMDAAEYKHVVLGLIFLKYIEDAFNELYNKFKEGKGEYEGADPEDKNEYVAEKVFYVPPSARWTWLQGRAKLPTIGRDIDDAMDAIERDNTSLRGVLPKVYAQEKLDKASVGSLIDLLSTATLGTKDAQSKDVLGKVYEYFLGEFALAEGKKGGQFYTPASVVKLLVEMLEPYEGRVFDPCCGSGGMFVQSEKFIKSHQDHYKKNNGKKLSLNPADHISIYGQESNQTTWRLAKMNLAIRGIDSSNVKWNNEGSFLNDAHKDLKADYIISNPPFNDSDWSGELLQKDARWFYGVPPYSNANFAWIQHFLFHISPAGSAGFVLANTSLNTMGIEGEIRKAIVKNKLVDCIVDLPAQLFFNTQIPACLWFLSRDRKNNKFRQRDNEILFIDGRKLGIMIKRKHKELSKTNIENIASTYHNWKNINGSYNDIPGFCKSVFIDEVEANNYVLAPARYVSTIEQEINLEINFKENKVSNELLKIKDGISVRIDNIIKEWNSKEKNVNIKHLISLMKLVSELNSISTLLYQSAINKYFLEFEINSKKIIEKINSTLGLIPIGWQVKTFGEIFEESKENVEDLGYCPKVYSVTNLGIQLREGKYTKELSKSTSKYKIAHCGDMVFGLSREIPNLDVFTDTIGAFSPAYTIFSPKDIRLGLMIGCIMRLKLMEQTDILKGGAREGKTLDKDRLLTKKFAIPGNEQLDQLWEL
jgi:type I restriction enzyme M protein